MSAPMYSLDQSGKKESKKQLNMKREDGFETTYKMVEDMTLRRRFKNPK